MPLLAIRLSIGFSDEAIIFYHFLFISRRHLFFTSGVFLSFSFSAYVSSTDEASPAIFSTSFIFTRRQPAIFFIISSALRFLFTPNIFFASIFVH